MFFPVFPQSVPEGVGVVVKREEQSVTGENLQVELRDVQNLRCQRWENE